MTKTAGVGSGALWLSPRVLEIILWSVRLRDGPGPNPAGECGGAVVAESVARGAALPSRRPPGPFFLAADPTPASLSLGRTSGLGPHVSPSRRYRRVTGH